jgi:hypothetical protein
MRSNYKDLKAVFFDEVSLVGKTMLAFVDQRLRQFTGKNEFMGGLHVIFVGDLFQLKPVKDGYVFEDLKSGFNALGGNLWADNVVMYELYEQMRQKDARVFADRLNRLREGEQTPEDIAFFQTLVIDRNNPPPEYNLFIKHLFATNKELDAHNALVYDRSNSLALLCRARDTFLAWSLTVSRRQILTKVLDSVPPKNFYGLHQTLNLRVGLMVEVVLNEDVSDGIFNGAYGHLRSVTLNENDVPSRLWVEFANERIGQQLRKRFGTVKSRVVTGAGPSIAPDEKWTAMYPVSRCHRITPMQDSEVRRVQFPVRPATACTFNRAQGSTLSIAAMDFRGMPSAGRHYVGLSRLTNPENLFLFDFAADSIRTAPQVKAEMKRMRGGFRVQLLAPNLSNAYPASFTLLAHNARSLHAHVAEVRADINFQAADIILHSETRARASDTPHHYHLDGYLCTRADAAPRAEDVVRPHHGTAIHTREALELGSHAIESVRGLDLLLQTVHTGLPGLEEFDFLSLYRSEQFASVASFCEHLTPLLERLQSRCAMIAGNFNIDLFHHSPPTLMLQKLMRKYGFRQLVCVHTHKYGALLDHIWTNLNAENFEITTGACVTYWSDHSPTWCCIQPR